MASIALTNRRGQVIARVRVDAEDLMELTRYRWHFNGEYAARRPTGGAVVYMHRQLLGLTPGDGLQGDHVNQNKLDNRRGNLRAVTQAENAQNLTVRNQPGKTSRFRGVSLETRTGKWIASATINGRFHNIGRFEREEDAAEAAAAFRRQHMPFAPEARKAVA